MPSYDLPTFWPLPDRPGFALLLDMNKIVTQADAVALGYHEASDMLKTLLADNVDFDARKAERQREKVRQEAAKSRAEAKAKAETEGRDEHARRFSRQLSEQQAYAAAILSLPQAKGREAAARKIGEAHNYSSLPIPRAALLLGGLPRDDVAPPPKADPQAVSVLRGQCERRIVALSHRVQNGDMTARKEANAIAYALRVSSTTNISLKQALACCGVVIIEGT